MSKKPTLTLNMNSKQNRLEKIRRFIRENKVGTQDAIVEHLREAGISATQATVSRDIKELGIIKTPLKGSAYFYELPRVQHSGKLAENNLQTFERMGSFLNLKLVPGTAYLVKRHLQEDFDDIIFSMISDDNSILIVARSEEKAQFIEQRLMEW